MAPTTGTGGRTALSWMFCGLALMLAVWYGHAQYTEAKERAEAKRAKAVQEAAEYAKTHPPEQRIIVPVERPWTMQTLGIPPQGLPVYLYPGWKDLLGT